MNLPRYEFHRHNENNLLLFLKTANDQKNGSNCDMHEYEKLKLFCPLDGELKEKLKRYYEKIEDDIEIISDDDLIACNDDNLKKEISELVEDFTVLNRTETDVHKVVDILSGCLTMHEEIPNTVLKDLPNLDNKTLEGIFKCLGDTISLDEAELFWNSIDGLHESVMFCYIRIIFLAKATQEYKNSVSDMFVKLSEAYSSFFLKELTRKCVEEDVNEVLPKYLVNLNSDFKKELLRNIIGASDKLETKSIAMFEVLLDSGDKTTLTQLLELMCNSAMEFIQDNSYGKLLFNIVNTSKQFIPMWETLLRDILNMNQSIWKIKVQKIITSQLNDTLCSTFS
ncbi:uncharacterized protein LOC143200977 [Rhynchophorus ferrugineus]|uniref:uncharacterized protein LOC143200977 n=1 Tax=Rhynchophorus ferrugineus TaxID=354439 RepID=UPI003FCDEB92